MLDWGVTGMMRVVWYLSWSLGPLWLVLTWWSHKRRQKQGQKFGEPRLTLATATSSIWKTESHLRQARSGKKETVVNLIRSSLRRRENMKTILVLLALIAISVALGRPQWGHRQEEVHQQGVDMVLCVDTSVSMKAQDVAPSRLDKARSEIGSLLAQLSGNRVGLVGFATTTRLHCPLTLDFRGLRSILDHSFSFGPGTDVEAAISACARVLESSDARTRVVLLISDGEDHGGNIDRAIDLANNANIKIFTLGIGTREGGPIPLGDKEDDGYKKVKDELVWTRLEDDVMRRLAAETGGEYFEASSTETEVLAITTAIDQLEKSEFSQTMTTRREDQFGWFLLLAAFLLALEIVFDPVGTIAWEDSSD